MKCREIHQHLKRIGTWVDWEDTTDTFKAGDPDTDVTCVAVAWKASFSALKQAREMGAQMLISHESIAVKAVNGSTLPDASFALPTEREKFEWLERSGLVVYRCHDVWDRFPKIGIRDTWQRKLDLGGRIAADEYPLLVTEIEPVTAGALSEVVLSRIKPLGQAAVLLTGDRTQIVSRLATGTGVTVDPTRMIALGADAGICTDDYYQHVRMGVHASELGFPVITVNHGVSEYWGIENLVRYLGETFTSLDVHHIEQSCPYDVIA